MFSIRRMACLVLLGGVCFGQTPQDTVYKQVFNGITGVAPVFDTRIPNIGQTSHQLVAQAIGAGCTGWNVGLEASTDGTYYFDLINKHSSVTNTYLLITTVGSYPYLIVSANPGSVTCAVTVAYIGTKTPIAQLMSGTDATGFPAMVTTPNIANMTQHALGTFNYGGNIYGYSVSNENIDLPTLVNPYPHTFIGIMVGVAGTGSTVELQAPDGAGGFVTIMTLDTTKVGWYPFPYTFPVQTDPLQGVWRLVTAGTSPAKITYIYKTDEF